MGYSMKDGLGISEYVGWFLIAWSRMVYLL